MIQFDIVFGKSLGILLMAKTKKQTSLSVRVPTIESLKNGNLASSLSLAVGLIDSNILSD
jgi:steroid delta-isomerase-like uncharacterized protein